MLPASSFRRCAWRVRLSNPERPSRACWQVSGWSARPGLVARRANSVPPHAQHRPGEPGLVRLRAGRDRGLRHARSRVSPALLGLALAAAVNEPAGCFSGCAAGAAVGVGPVMVASLTAGEALASRSGATGGVDRRWSRRSGLGCPRCCSGLLRRCGTSMPIACGSRQRQNDCWASLHPASMFVSVGMAPIGAAAGWIA